MSKLDSLVAKFHLADARLSAARAAYDAQPERVRFRKGWCRIFEGDRTPDPIEEERHAAYSEWSGVIKSLVQLRQAA